MEKLIKELDEYYEQEKVTGSYGGWQIGFENALSMVKKHNPWYNINELPPEDKYLPGYSIEVILLNRYQVKDLGRYYYGTRKWTDVNGQDPIKWAYLPEVVNEKTN